MNTEQKIALVKRNTEEFISQIDEIGFNEDLGLSKFILISCLIDAVSSYCYPKKNNNEQYKDFIKTYLGRVNEIYEDEVNATVLYASIRCSLVHSFSISKGVLLTEAGDSRIHFERNNQNHLIVDLITLFDDLKKAIKLYFKDLSSGKRDMQKNFKKGFSKNPPFEIFKSVDMIDPNQPVTGSSQIQTISYRKVNFRRSHNS